MDVNGLFHDTVVLFLAKESASTQFRGGCVDPGGEGEKIRVSARKIILKKPLSKRIDTKIMTIQSCCLHSSLLCTKVLHEFSSFLS